VASAELELDFRVLFEASPDVLLVLRPDAPRYTMVAATRARLEATHTTLAETLGRGLFELFPDNPDDPAATGSRNLRASLDRVVATRAPDTMAVQKYDIRGPDGVFEARYWSPKNLPVLSPDGSLAYIFHRVEDVTELVRASEAGVELRDRTRAMEREVVARSRELAAANRGLREANARLGELDQAKTAFFSNVSHEFRTPLTLMLGPLEDALADRADPLGPAQARRLRMVEGNAVRLLKLVNALLDFSRLEAGRAEACFAPLDAARFTAELAGMFQSATEKANLALRVDCPPLRELPWVDREMWEKIVLNLVSNAFKFTPAGSISVQVREEPARVVLEVADTGVGIPTAELPRIFERFHRVAGVQGRTFEGTGIGLALVDELVTLHGGEVGVESRLGVGTTFRVAIPKGWRHLPAERVSQQPAEPPPPGVVAGDAAEAARWLPPEPADPELEVAVPPSGSARAEPARPGPGERLAGARPRVLVADDNRDLREYMAMLLAPSHEVHTAVDGQQALELARASPPDLVVSDVMMPNLDGFGLVRALRADARTRALPVILLSARAGQEAERESLVEGLDAGADDYVVKPFAARELLARVRTHIELARIRRAWIAELERANRDLDAFSYSVSHDLRAPLRAIDGFSQVLEETYAAVLEPQARTYLGHIRKGVARMTALIEALLELARVSRGPLRSDRVDLSELAAGVVEDLRGASPDRCVEVVVQPGLLAIGDRRLLHAVLVNLIGNAWKFTRTRPRARLEVGQRAPEPPTFFVGDNGVGFDPAEASRLFAPFQRLHRADAFEGTGIGLATVQRIVERHGGRIWAEAELDRGATFSFTLPARPPAWT
jgi:signal transduction histidine kinase